MARDAVYTSFSRIAAVSDVFGAVIGVSLLNIKFDFWKKQIFFTPALIEVNVVAFFQKVHLR